MLVQNSFIKLFESLIVINNIWGILNANGFQTSKVFYNNRKVWAQKEIHIWHCVINLIELALNKSELCSSLESNNLPAKIYPKLEITKYKAEGSVDFSTPIISQKYQY